MLQGYVQFTLTGRGIFVRRRAETEPAIQADQQQTQSAPQPFHLTLIRFRAGCLREPMVPRRPEKESFNKKRGCIFVEQAFAVNHWALAKIP
jgi:hypothetical protein